MSNTDPASVSTAESPSPVGSVNASNTPVLESAVTPQQYFNLYQNILFTLAAGSANGCLLRNEPKQVLDDILDAYQEGLTTPYQMLNDATISTTALGMICRP